MIRGVLALLLVYCVLGNPPVTKKVFMDIAINSKPAGRIEIGLYGSTLPKTVENFRALCTGENGFDSYGNRLHYKNTTFHYIATGLMIVGGDVTMQDGLGITSIYGKEFPDENFKAKHEKPGMVAMHSYGKNENGCQFYISLSKTNRMDGRFVVFGEVLSGMEVVSRIDLIGERYARPGDLIVISECGEL